MIEKIIGKIVYICENVIEINFHNLIFKINVLNCDLKHLKLNSLQEIFIYINFNYLEIFGFLNKKDKDLFEELIKIKNVGSKISWNILNIFGYDIFIKISSEYNFEFFIEKYKLRLKTLEDIFKIINKKYSNVIFSIQEIKIIKTLIKLGYDHKVVYQIISKNKYNLQNNKYKLDNILKNIILELNEKVLN